jgi:hypothetical protein
VAADVVDEVAPLLIDGGDPGTAGEHVGPLALLVPVQLADAAGLETHVDAGRRLGDRRSCDRRVVSISG